MTRERLAALLKITGPIIPEAMEECIGDLETAEKELLPRIDELAHERGQLVAENDTRPGVLQKLDHRVLAGSRSRLIARLHALVSIQP